MAFKDDYDFELLVNEAQNLVLEELEIQLTDPQNENICRCQECVLDMATLALNNIKPKYRSSLTGIIYSQQYKFGDYHNEIVKAVTDAIAKVDKNPSHDV